MSAESWSKPLGISTSGEETETDRLLRGMQAWCATVDERQSTVEDWDDDVAA